MDAGLRQLIKFRSDLGPNLGPTEAATMIRNLRQIDEGLLGYEPRGRGFESLRARLSLTKTPVRPVADVIPQGRTAKLKQFADLLESGERNSPMHACARERSSETDFKGPSRGSA